LKTRQKIIIDNLFGTPLVYLINALARFLGFILRIDHNLNREFNTIVISKYVGLGSIIQATPLIQTLRKRFPNAKIIFATRSSNQTLLKHISEIDEVMVIDDNNIFSVISSTAKFIFKLWNVKPELFIDLEYYSNYSSIVTTLSKATNRFGFYKQNKPYRKGVYNCLVGFSVDSPISEIYLQFADLLHIKGQIKNLKLEVQEENYHETILERTQLSVCDSYIVINPNASDLRVERRWPKYSYIDLINSILKNYPKHKVVLVGAKSETNYVAEIENEILDKTNLVNTAGKLSLSELIFLISKAALMISNDTGPMHIAFAVNTKTIALFGPCSPLQYGGFHAGEIFYKKVHCSPCVHKYLRPPCHGDNICMKSISAEEVENAVFRHLS